MLVRFKQDEIAAGYICCVENNIMVL